MTTIEIISVISPFISAALTAYITHRLTTNSKKFDILYENKLPAFKEIASKIIDFRNFCDGRVAYLNGNENSPFYEEGVGTLSHRTIIANVFSSNSIFLSHESRRVITDLLNNMSGLCSAEVSIISGDKALNPISEYKRLLIMADSIVDILYNELNLAEE